MGGTLSGLLGGDAAAAAESTIDESSGPSYITAFHSSQRWQLHFNSSKQLNKLISVEPISGKKVEHNGIKVERLGQIGKRP